MTFVMAEPADLMRQAWKTDDKSLAYAIEGIDARLGKGYAKAHPELIAAFMQTAARDFHTGISAKALGESVAELTDMLRAERMLWRPDAPPFDQVVRRVTGLVAQKWPRIEALADGLVQYPPS